MMAKYSSGSKFGLRTNNHQLVPSVHTSTARCPPTFHQDNIPGSHPTTKQTGFNPLPWITEDMEATICPWDRNALCICCGKLPFLPILCTVAHSNTRIQEHSNNRHMHHLSKLAHKLNHILRPLLHRHRPTRNPLRIPKTCPA